jgi:TrbC/VIRB2 pilin
MSLKKIFYTTNVKWIFTLLSLAPVLAFAQVPDSVDAVKDRFCVIFNWIYTFALIVGVICVIFAAFTYMTSEGNSEKVGTANKMLLYAVIGIGIAIISAGVPALVGDIVGNPAVGRGC